MIRTIRWCGLGLLLTLTACTGSSYLQKARNIESWKQNRTALEQIRQWELFGKIAIRSGEENFTASLKWNQDNGQQQIRLLAPFSQGTIELKGSEEQGYEVVTASGEKHHVDSPASVTQHAFGVGLPFTELQFWLKGLPDREGDVWKAEFNDDNRLTGFQQSGWQVTIARYREFNGKTLPAKLILKRLADITERDVEVRIVLQRWQIK